MTDDPYWDQTTGVLYNRLGIVDAETLRRVEADLTHVALADLGSRVLPGGYGLAHLHAFHREIFGDVYAWAGQLRSVRIAKTDLFCLPQHIQPYSADVLGALTKDAHLRGLSRPAFLDRLTHYFAEVNAIHPFREGNGRAQRAFFHQLARQAGWSVDWSRLDREANIAASVASIRGDNAPLWALLDDLVSS